MEFERFVTEVGSKVDWIFTLTAAVYNLTRIRTCIPDEECRHERSGTGRMKARRAVVEAPDPARSSTEPVRRDLFEHRALIRPGLGQADGVLQPPARRFLGAF